MSQRARLGILLLGLALFVYLIVRIGLRTLAADAAATGWWIVPILLVYGVVYAGNALAWRIVMAGEPGRPSFLQTYALTISGFALNYLTPVVSLGASPTRRRPCRRPWARGAPPAPWSSTRCSTR